MHVVLQMHVVLHLRATERSGTTAIKLGGLPGLLRGEKSDEPPPDDAVLTAQVFDALYREAGLPLRGTRKAS
jgi:hypothetical protein